MTTERSATERSATEPSPTRPLRRDAAQNRVRLLDAAMLVFAERGLDGSVEQVAREAGVGVGTLYRRFPTKQALVDALVGDARRDLLALARSAARQPGGTGLETLLAQAGEFQAGRRGCLHRLWDHSDAELRAMREFRRIVRALLRTAQHHGRIRDDVTATDVTMTLWSLRGVIETTGAVAPDAWRRHVELVVAGMRPPSARFRVDLRAAPLTDAQARRLTSAGNTPTHPVQRLQPAQPAQPAQPVRPGR